jgi:hypothetical protein
MYISLIRRLKDRSGNYSNETCRIVSVNLNNDDINYKFIPVETRLGSGKSFGPRGITKFQGNIWVASSGNDLFVLDSNSLKVKRHLKTPPEISSNAGLHQIREHGGFLWICSAGSDCLIKHDGDNVLSVKHIAEYKEIIEPRIIKHYDHSWGKDKVHFNSVAWDEYENEYHVYCACYGIFNWTNKEWVVQGGPINSPHDIAIRDGWCYFNSSATNTTWALEMSSSKLIEVHKEGSEKSSQRQKGFARGMALDIDGLLYVTYTPCILQVYDTKRNFKLLHRKEISVDKDETSYDILLD